jgi:hypothetical protein
MQIGFMRKLKVAAGALNMRENEETLSLCLTN